MATGYSFNGSCYSATADVLTMFKSQFPMVSPDHVIDFVSASVAGSVLTYNVNARSMDANTLSSRIGSVTLQSCGTVNMGLDLYPVQDVLFAVAAVFVLVLGMATGLKR